MGRQAGVQTIPEAALEMSTYPRHFNPRRAPAASPGPTVPRGAHTRT